MAEAPSLGDFFAKKTKKKIKATNLNNTGKEETKPEEAPKKAAKGKATDDDGWQEEEVVQATMKVEAAGKLIREEEKAEEQDYAAPAWGNTKVKENKDLNDRKFPSLAKSIQSSNIVLEDDRGKINIQTSKNMFANLEVDNGSDDDVPKRPSQIKPAMVTKKKGERAQDAIQREVGKYVKDKTPKAGADEDDEEDAEEKEARAEKRKADKKAKAAEGAKPAAAEEEKEEQAEDVKIEPDLVAAKAKYAHRKKLEKVDLPDEELEAEKENKPTQKSGQSGKKKKVAAFDEDDGAKKLQYAEWD